jgi:hypothetical protein
LSAKIRPTAARQPWEKLDTFQTVARCTLRLPGVHPEFGTMTLGPAAWRTWATRGMAHGAQISADL